MTRQQRQSHGFKSAAKDFISKRREDIALHLTWTPHLAAIVCTVLAFIYAPAVDRKHPPDRLTTFFVVVAGTLVAIAVVLLFIQRSSDNVHALRFLGVSTVLYFIVAIVAAVIGLLPLPNASFRFIFAIVVGGGVAGLLTFGLVTATSISDQRKAVRTARLNELSKKKKEH